MGDNLFYYPFSGIFYNSNLGNGIVSQIALDLSFQVGDSAVSRTSSINRTAQLKFYNEVDDPESSPSFEATDVTLYREPTENSYIGLTIFRTADLKKFNKVKKVILTDGANKITYTFNRYRYLQQHSPGVYSSRTKKSLIDALRLNATSELSYDGSKFNLVAIGTYDTAAHDVIVQNVTNVEDFVSSDIPFILLTQRLTKDFTGTTLDINTIKVNLYLDRINPDMEPDLVLTPTVTSVLNPPETPETPNEQGYTPSIESISIDDDSRVIGIWALNPDPTLAKFKSMAFQQQTILESNTPISTSTRLSYEVKDFVGQIINDGDRIRCRLAFTDTEDKIYRSSWVIYKLIKGVLVPENMIYEELEIQSTKIIVEKVRATTIDFVLINDSFNSDFVEQIIIQYTVSGKAVEQIIENDNSSSNIDVSLTNLIAETAYELSIYAKTENDQFLVQSVSVKTTIDLPQDPTPEDIQKQSMQQITHMAYDNDLLESIEGFPSEHQQQVADDIMHIIQDPASLGYTADRNRRNRKSSVYNAGQSDSVRTNYPRTIEQILSTNSLNIPDIDEDRI